MSQEIGCRHVQELERYLEGLREAGRALPGHGGKVNICAVAAACGFNREVLYQNRRCRQMLAGAAAKYGLEGSDAREWEADPERAKLERHLARLEKKNCALAAEVDELRRRLVAYRHIEEMMETGKRVIL